MMKSLKTITVFLVGLIAFSNCQKDSNDTGKEFAPQMYHSLPYEPYTQITDKSSEYYNTNPYNPTTANLRKPVVGTVKRNFGITMVNPVRVADTLMYALHPDSLDYASRALKSPYPADVAQVLKEGEVLYLRFCQHCHGKNGDGKGKVADMYSGVPSYKSGRVAQLNEGHIFHVITYGKGLMWPHGSQIQPDERWKIARYVKSLQK